MTTTAILLLIISAVLHASWNFISKKGRPSAAFLMTANVMGSLMLLPVAVKHAPLYLVYPSCIWTLLLTTCMFQSIYYTSLAGAYRTGDMSLAYPLARSSPVIVVMAVSFLLGQGDELSSLCVIGVVLVVSGCFMVPMKTFREFRLKNYLSRTCGLALLAAVGTAGYSIVDSEALKTLRDHFGNTESIIALTLMYAFLEALCTSVFLSLYIASRKKERRAMAHVLKSEKRRALLAGICIYTTYSLVLISMSLARNVSYVVGFRQLSIPIGVFMGIALLKEPVSKPKICGVATLVCGLILIAVG